MSRPACSCSLTMQLTASRYCSRKRESPSASLKGRPRRTSVNHDGRGQEPVTVVGNVRSRVALSMGQLLGTRRGAPPPFRTSPQDAVRAAGRPRAGPRASEASNPEVAPAKPALEHVDAGAPAFLTPGTRLPWVRLALHSARRHTPALCGRALLDVI